MSFDSVHKIIPAFVTGEISQEKADQLIQRTKEVNDGSLHVFFSDQRPQYREAILKSFGQWVQPERKGTRGPFPKPRLQPAANLLYAQVVKHRRKGRVVKITEKVVFGTQEALEAYLEQSPVSRRINTAFVERQNNTMRQHNRRFTRKTLGFSKDDYWLERQVHLCVGYYHFCLPHGGLREEIFPPIPTKGSGSPKKWRQVTPAMSAGVTDHVWTLQELLTYRLPPDAQVGTSCAQPRLSSGGPEQTAPTRTSPRAIIISTVKGH
jgi:IS1 family transposase